MIPKIIHQVWLGEPNPSVVRATKTWECAHPSWEYRLWTSYDSFSPAMREVLDAISQTEQPGKFAGMADVMRLFVLWRFGGVAIDADSECLCPMDDRFLTPYEWACWENEQHCPGVIANGTMGAEPGSLLVSRMIQRLPLRDPAAPPWQSYGPHYLTEMAHGYRRLSVFPSRHFTPWHYKGFPAPGDAKAFARQFWMNTLKLSRLDVTDPRIVVVSTGIDVATWAPACVQSVLTQSVACRHIIVTDDGITMAAAETTARTHARGPLVRVEAGRGSAVLNLEDAVRSLPDDVIVVWLDLDDRLAHDEVIASLLEEYAADPELLLTYGTCRGWPDDSWTWPTDPYHPAIVERGTYRRAEWKGNHLRTFRAGLFKQVPPALLRGGNGSNIDQLVMLPMLEIAAKHARHIPSVMVHYNQRSFPHPPDVVRAEEAENDRIRGRGPLRHYRLNAAKGPELVVVSTGAQVAQWAPKCVGSVAGQTESVMHWIVAPDKATRQSLAGSPANARIHEADCLGHPLQNLESLVCMMAPETVVVWLDLDDWLACPEALEIVRHVYATTDCLVTYGSYREWPSRRWGECNGEYEPEVRRSRGYRKAPWRASHLRTFKAGLFHQLGDGDLKRPDGTWWDVRDMAVMLPLLELAGDRHRYIPEHLVWYNTRNLPLSREARAVEVVDENAIRALPKRPVWTLNERLPGKSRGQAVELGDG